MRAAAAAALLLLAAACSESPAARAAANAAAWLEAAQQPDGSFRSEKYAVLRSGQAMTPFVLRALQAAGAPKERLEPAVAFVRASIQEGGPVLEGGAIGYADLDVLEYPVYATANAILALVHHGDRQDRGRIATMAEWLARQQCGEHRSFKKDAPAYGAFGFGALGLGPGEPGHVDLCHTRFSLQALAAAGHLSPTVRDRATVLLSRMQREDGGFFFSPVVAEANKAGRDESGRFRPYATATADGVLALRALGVAEDDPRLTSALAWLERHAGAERIGGIGEQPAEPWHEALRFYHAMALAEAWPPLRAEFAAMLVPRQNDDGSFHSDLVTAMKEDDPLLATSLAVLALRAGAPDG